MKLVFQVSDRLIEISAEGPQMTRGELETLKRYLLVHESILPIEAESRPPVLHNHNEGTNPDQAQRLESQYRTFLERHPGFLVDCAYRFSCLWYEGVTYRKLIEEFPGVTNTDIGAIRFGFNLPRRKGDYEMKAPEEKINHARPDGVWPGR